MAEATVPELPGDDLRWRVAGTAKREWFWESGGMSVANIGTMLSIIGTSFADYPRALEFGCGCGRILLHMRQIAMKTELFGVDIDPEAIAWAQSHIPWVKCSVNDGLPPLNFPDGYFDLIFNQSVFTHLDENYQDAWLAELVRVTRPGGTLVLSVSGDHPFSQLVKAHQDAGADPANLLEKYRSKGIVFIEDDSWVGGPFPDFYHSTFHAPWYVFAHWSKYFDIKAYVTRGSLDFQDYLLLRRREGPAQLQGADQAAQPLPVASVAKRAALTPRRSAKRLWRELKYKLRGY
ncbi:MAG: class I SAM-dependent methyltransferase [Burkholderiales bacterium]|nr:class I SAM-dependent methyltransferase [Burkholderiales bacterium]